MSCLLSTSKNDMTTSLSNSSLFSKLQSSSLSLHLFPHLPPTNPGPLALIYSQSPSTHSRPCHLTRHAASANQGSRGTSPPNMDLFIPPASWCISWWLWLFSGVWGSQVQVIRLSCSPGRHLGTAATPTPHTHAWSFISWTTKLYEVTALCLYAALFS